MKVAVAKDGMYVSQHFGHCEGFEAFDLEDGKVVNQKFIANPGHRPGFLPPFLAEQGVNVIIAGGMGGTAQELFRDNGIEVIVGATGKIEEIIKLYLGGQLKSTESVCHEHMHHDECGTN